MQWRCVLGGAHERAPRPPAASRASFTVGQGMFRPKRTLHAVNGVDLDIHRGEVLGIVGESGCGKSTLARMLLGLLPPSAGAITLDGRDLRSLGRREIARRVQPVFQDPYSSLNPRRRVAAIVALPLEVHGIGTAAERAAGRDRDAGAGRSAGALRRPLPAPAVRRPAPARRHRPRPGDAPGDRDLRRADLGARRLGAVADPEPAAWTCAANSA